MRSFRFARRYATAAGQRPPSVVRKVLLTTTAILAAGYAGGIYYARHDNSFYDLFTARVPYSKEIISAIDNREYMQHAKKLNALRAENNPKRENVVVLGPKGDLVLETVETSDDGSKQPQIEIPESLVFSFDVEDIDPLLIEPVCLLNKIASEVPEMQTNETFKQLVSSLLASSNRFQIEKQFVLDQTKEALARETSRFESELETQYADRKQKLVQVYNERLQEMVNAVKERALTAYNNKLSAQAVSLQKEFTKRVAKAVDTERNGRLANLDQLSNEVGSIQDIIVKNAKTAASDKAIVDHYAKLTALQQALQSNSASVICLEPFVNELATSLPEDELVQQVVTAFKLDKSQHVNKGKGVTNSVKSAVSNLASKVIGRNDKADEKKTDEKKTDNKKENGKCAKECDPSKEEKCCKSESKQEPKPENDLTVLSRSELATRLRELEPELRRASLVRPGAGVLGHLGALAASAFLFRKEGLPKGDDIESILARTETYMQEGDLPRAVAEINALRGVPREVAQDWLVQGRRRCEAEFLVNALSLNAALLKG